MAVRVLLSAQITLIPITALDVSLLTFAGWWECLVAAGTGNVNGWSCLYCCCAGYRYARCSSGWPGLATRFVSLVSFVRWPYWRHLLMNHGTDMRKYKHCLGRTDGKKLSFLGTPKLSNSLLSFNLCFKIGWSEPYFLNLEGGVWLNRLEFTLNLHWWEKVPSLHPLALTKYSLHLTLNFLDGLFGLLSLDKLQLLWGGIPSSRSLYTQCLWRSRRYLMQSNEENFRINWD